MKYLRNIKRMAALAILVFLLAGCGKQEVKEGGEVTATPMPTVTAASTVTQTAMPTETPTPVPTGEPTSTSAPTLTPIPTVVPTPTVTPTAASTSTPTPTPLPTPTDAPTATPTSTPTPTPVETAESHIIVIDAGHQRKGNYDKEPNGPGSDTMKAKVSSGTQGVSTGLAEYELNLQVALKLRDELTARGYTVIMVRETHDVDISNVERAELANEAGAEAFLRIHANGSDDQSAKGVLTICQTAKNPYNSEWYEESRRLSELVLNEVVNQTGAKKRSVWETDTMTGINWAMVPSTILEMGFMTNPEEDKLLATEEYQDKIVRGVADALDLFFAKE
ncbi:MAG: N-acetylmuramoyl-L-alanine amidase [Lachnospiraceae bacterium]